MTRLLLLAAFFFGSAAFAQPCLNGQCGGTLRLNVSLAPEDFATLKAKIATYSASYRSLTEPCDRLVSYLAQAPTPDAIFNTSTWIPVSERFFPIDLTTGRARIQLRFKPGTLGFSCVNQVWTHRADDFAFAHPEAAD